MTIEDMFGQVMNFPFKTLPSVTMIGNKSADHALRHHKVQELIHSTKLHFDLVINEEVYHDVFLAFGHKFNAPVITMCKFIFSTNCYGRQMIKKLHRILGPFGVVDFMDHEMGLLTPYSHVPHTMLPYTDQMSFFQRWYNFVLSMYEWMIRRTVHVPLQTKLLKSYFSHLEPLPTFDEMRKNISIAFVNTHQSITYPRPSMPGLVYIGGAHIRPPKPLSADLKQFLDESEHGVIYFSLGTIMDSSKMPKEKLDIFFG